jgi:SAM-dependent methyltransferase
MFDAVGVGAGWRCLDVGAGAGSVTSMLADIVGPTGSVLAIDIDTRLLERLASDRVKVRAHDLLTQELRDEPFDLVHARNLLMHLPARMRALERMAASVRPGGTLAIGDVTMVDFTMLDGGAVWGRTWSAFNDALVRIGWDARYGHRLVEDLEAIGLVEVRGEQVRHYDRGGSIGARLLSGTITRLRDQMDAAPEDVEGALALLADPGTSFWTWTLMVAWGRRA